MSSPITRIVIVGGGFGGIRAALCLARKRLPNTTVTLISDKSHFEYHPALYRFVTGNSPLEVCIPLQEIFEGSSVEVIEASITSLNREGKTVIDAQGVSYSYDHLILALGSETTYFGVPGLKEFSFGMKTVAEALRLKQQIIQTILSCQDTTLTTGEKTRNASFVVIGAGATGVEVAGRLIVYARSIAVAYGIDPSLVSVELIEGAPKILPALPEKFTRHIDTHLRELGVNIFCNRAVERQEVEEVFLKDMKIGTRTVIWTAGVRANGLYESLGFPVDKRGRVEVDEHLRVKGEDRIFVMGDAAITQYSGYAQTAFYDGAYLARVIQAVVTERAFPFYKPGRPVNAIPAGPQWAAVLFLGSHFYGRIGWWLRRIADLESFLLILPFHKAFKVFWSGCISDTCTLCDSDKPHTHTES